jgi:hypothetical protein
MFFSIYLGDMGEEGAECEGSEHTEACLKRGYSFPYQERDSPNYGRSHGFQHSEEGSQPHGYGLCDHHYII